MGKDTGNILYVLVTAVCPNHKCQKTTVMVSQWMAESLGNNQWRIDSEAKAPLRQWNLMPRSRAKQYASYVPIAIREDHEEAHLIVTDSPKASATLARRALQGIMQDFYSAKPGRFGLGPESGARNNCGFPPMKANRRSAHAKEPVHGIVNSPDPRRIQGRCVDGRISAA